ncbi:helix-turn-helix domain-containing protein [Christiangramia sp. SM2212]|uniref:Helix-turn-helix domain-containing protein n=1 Tax=Christiangramia sediminicola TaxID=3073267 RepID=A0ABU1ES34_9FLAO|nr:helix-turn-helix domain-containing protein [Christiangramia sp. SM2212]MDR5591210.1 helix-turn-helix domain-containing protein [Christiangramia sp. SM2212]
MNSISKDFLFIPIQVRYCNGLPPNAKILFGEIASRANEENKAIFHYDEFPELFGVNKKAVYLWISALEKEGFLKSRMIRKQKEHYHIFLLTTGITSPG